MADISPAVRRLLGDHIASVSQLDVLLLLQREGTERWTAATVARRLRTQPEIAEATLAKFARAGIVTVELDGDGAPCFIYRPASRATAEAIAALAALYTTHKTTVISTIFSGPRDSLQDFADSFRLRGDS